MFTAPNDHGIHDFSSSEVAISGKLQVTQSMSDFMLVFGGLVRHSIGLPNCT
jgi:hypothetical protein